MSEARAGPWLALSVALLSAAALGYQILLMRWLAIAHWQPFAAMIISLALLGHGASGTALSLLRGWAVARFDALYPLCAAAFALAAPGCVTLAQTIPFNGLALVWDLRQLGWLAALYLCLALPFFFAACCFGLAFARHPAHIPRLYGADLFGAGLGAALAIGLLFLLPLPQALAAVAALGLVAAGLAALAGARRLRRLAGLAALGVLLAAVLDGTALQPSLNEYKGLAQALRLRDAAVIDQRHSPYGWLAVVESPTVPLRHAPGLSLHNSQEPPPQLGVFVDGDALGAITRAVDDPARLDWLGRMTSALPYVLLDGPRVLVLGAGAGMDVLQALHLGAQHVHAVEPNPQLLALLCEDYADYAGAPCADPRVRMTVGDARAALRGGGADYELIVWPLAESLGGAASGAFAAEENYALTVEAFVAALRRLAPGGLLALTRWEKLPPRDMLKLFATAVTALEREGAAEPGARLAAIRGWSTGTLLVARDPFDAARIARLRDFAEGLGFDPVHYPGMPADEANRYSLLARPWAFEGARALLSPARAQFLRDYKFDLRPASDDRPYFAHFFRWRALPELWALRGQGAAVLFDAGYLLLLAALAQALPLSLLLILAPLLALPRGAAAGGSRTRPALYFLCLGLAFLLIEIACLARLKLLVGQPLLAITVGLAGFLCFAGLGSLQAQRFDPDPARFPPRLRRIVAGIALALGWHVLVVALALHWGGALALPWRALLGLLSIAPLAFLMGMPFPLGLSRLARSQPAFVPWAWGINGCASVLAALLALLLAIDLGLPATLLIAWLLYALAALCWPLPRDPGAADAARPRGKLLRFPSFFTPPAARSARGSAAG
ncbi:MAG: spermidine synthase [Rehaibacterium terrae]|uniref:spermidine synthase n=1 Tax=Rehaibacterium terrae TaxID=1341696 RepID=UPI00391D85B8